MVHFVKFASCAKANDAITARLHEILAAVLRLHYSAADEHVSQIGCIYADAVHSGLLVEGGLPASLIHPTHIPFLVAKLVRERDHDFVLNSSSFKKFAAGIDGLIVAAVRDNLVQAQIVPEHADAELHLEFAGYVRRESASAITRMSSDSLVVGKSAKWAEKVAAWLREGRRGKMKVATAQKLMRIASCSVPGFIVWKGYDLQSLDRRSNGILRKMLEQSLAVEGMQDSALAVEQLIQLAGASASRHTS